MAEHPEKDGGIGGGADAWRRSEMRILERRIREGVFRLSDKALVETAAAMEKIATTGRYPRNRIAAARVLVAMANANIQAAKLTDGETLNLDVAGNLTVDARRSRLGAICAAALERAGVRGSNGAFDRNGADPGRNGAGPGPTG